jgi:hypothetical protein
MTQREGTVTRHIAVIGGLFAFFLVTNMSAVQARSVPPVSTVVLHRTDMPAGFIVGTNKVISRPPPTFVSFRHPVPTYETEFTHNVTTGIQDVDDVVARFNSADEARRYYTLATVHQPPKGPECYRTTIGSISAVQVGSRCNGTLQGGHLTVDGVWFCRGPYFVFLAVAGTFNSFPRSRISHFAQIIDGRIRHAP